MARSIVVVGACGTGKSTLVDTLRALGYNARVVAQEHSAVHELWAHEGWPDALIMLDASPQVISQRRRNEFPEWLYQQQQERLRSAYDHATLYLHTDDLTFDQVRQKVMEHLQALEIDPEHRPQHA
jgi:deoxyadenosine/deoxycytidine kinase